MLEEVFGFVKEKLECWSEGSRRRFSPDREAAGDSSRGESTSAIRAGPRGYRNLMEKGWTGASLRIQVAILSDSAHRCNCRAEQEASRLQQGRSVKGRDRWASKATM